MSSRLFGQAEGEAVPLDPEDVLADWEHRAQQQTTLTMELSQRMQHTTASAKSRGAEVVATVDHSGGLADLRLSDRAMRLPATELAAIILHTSRQAQAAMAQQMGDMVRGLYGSDSDTASFIANTYAEQFPEPPDEERDPR
jgi:hypothetical protein